MSGESGLIRWLNLSGIEEVHPLSSHHENRKRHLVHELTKFEDSQKTGHLKFFLNPFYICHLAMSHRHLLSTPDHPFPFSHLSPTLKAGVYSEKNLKKVINFQFLLGFSLLWQQDSEHLTCQIGEINSLFFFYYLNSLFFFYYSNVFVFLYCVL